MKWIALVLGLVLTVSSSVAFGGFYSPRHNVFHLTEGMGKNGENYSPLIRALETAKSGDVVTIVLDHNNGGYVDTAAEIMRAMKASEATVVTVDRGWASSAALDVLFSGDKIVIYKNKSVGVAHLGSAGAAAWNVKFMAFYKRFLTADEWRRVLNGEDVYLNGSTICAIAGNLAENSKDHCVING